MSLVFRSLCRLRRAVVLLACGLLFAGTPVFAAETATAVAGPVEAVAGIDFQAIEWVVGQEIATGDIHGAVVLIGDRSRVLYRRAFGERANKPNPEAMTANTIFDLASLTKVVATTTAALQLHEQGKLRLDDPVMRYWPEFGSHGKAPITVRQLLTHTSGLAADLDLSQDWTGRRVALRMLTRSVPVAAPDERYIYSDLNFIALGEVVRRVSGLALEVYCSRYIFHPLGMTETSFKPSRGKRARIAPTEFRHGVMLRGEVHDPTADRMGGIAGHAGLFSTADDLARFAQTLLNGGHRIGDTTAFQVLRPQTIALMTEPNRVAANEARGLGWDLAAPFVVNRDVLPPFGAFGHTGFTGTSVWIDPVTDRFLIILSNRVHPDGGGDARPLRKALAELLSVAQPEARMSGTRRVTYARTVAALPAFETGADVLRREDFAPLKGLRVGLITNQTGRTSDGERLVDALRTAPGVRLTALFSPEHGLEGLMDERVGDATDAATRLPVYSLYGSVKRPTEAMLKGLDALVFDIQDSGTRFYTYITTMAYAMEAAAHAGIRFFVIDRPDPISAALVQGPMLDDDLRSFTGYFPLPLRHGMTVGELSRLFNSEARIGASLEVIAMRGYRRAEWLDETGLPWIAPSPNLRSLEAMALYPGVGMLEAANISVGRGTATPFQLIGAPWIEGPALADYLVKRGIPGIRFIPALFTPVTSTFTGKPCAGVRLLLVDRKALDAGRLGVELESALYRLYPGRFDIDSTLSLLGSRAALEAIKRGDDPVAIAQGWEARLGSFRDLRSRYLLYSELP